MILPWRTPSPSPSPFPAATGSHLASFQPLLNPSLALSRPRNPAVGMTLTGSSRNGNNRNFSAKPQLIAMRAVRLIKNKHFYLEKKPESNYTIFVPLPEGSRCPIKVRKVILCLLPLKKPDLNYLKNASLKL